MLFKTIIFYDLQIYYTSIIIYKLTNNKYVILKYKNALILLVNLIYDTRNSSKHKRKIKILSCDT
jgi:hypothetical protein